MLQILIWLLITAACATTRRSCEEVVLAAQQTLTVFEPVIGLLPRPTVVRLSGEATLARLLYQLGLFGQLLRMLLLL